MLCQNGNNVRTKNGWRTYMLMSLPYVSDRFGLQYYAARNEMNIYSTIHYNLAPNRSEYKRIGTATTHLISYSTNTESNLHNWIKYVSFESIQIDTWDISSKIKLGFSTKQPPTQKHG